MTFYFTFLVSNNFNSFDSGYLFLIFSIIQFYIIFSRFGQDQIIIKRLGENKIESKNISFYLSNSFLIVILMSFIIIILNIFLPDIFYDFFFKIKFPKLMIFSIIPFSLIWCFVGVFRGLNYQFFSNFYENGLFYLIFVISFFLLDISSVSSYLNSYLVCAFITFFIIYCHLVFKGIYFKTGMRLDDLKESRNITFSSLVSFLIINLPIYLAAFYNNSDDITFYLVCLRISFLISVAVAIINSIYAPIYSKFYFLNDNKKLKYNYNKSRKELILISFLVLIFVFAFSKQLLLIFNLTADFKNIFMLNLFCFSQFICVSTGTTGLFLNLTDNAKVLRNNTFISLIFSFLIGVVLIKYFSIYGMLVAYCLGIILENFLSLISVNKCLKK